MTITRKKAEKNHKLNFVNVKHSTSNSHQINKIRHDGLWAPSTSYAT